MSRSRSQPRPLHPALEAAGPRASALKSRRSQPRAECPMSCRAARHPLLHPVVTCRDAVLMECRSFQHAPRRRIMFDFFVCYNTAGWIRNKLAADIITVA
eukprot:7207846-Prymnesium_polylepis.1